MDLDDIPQHIPRLVTENGVIWQLHDYGPDKNIGKDVPLYHVIHPPAEVLVAHYEKPRISLPVKPAKKLKAKPGETLEKKPAEPPKPQPSNRMLAGVITCPMDIDHTGETLQGDPQKGAVRISDKQFDALYHAVAVGSDWWPLTDERWNSRDYFDKLEKYVMYLHDLPIGFFTLDRENAGEGAVRIVHIGLIKPMQGMQFGSRLLKEAEEMAWQGSTLEHGRADRIVLNTAPEHDRMQGDKASAPAATFYTTHGYSLAGQPEVIDTAQAIASGNVQKLNLPGYYQKDGPYSSSALFSRLCTAFHCDKSESMLRMIESVRDMPRAYNRPAQRG